MLWIISYILSLTALVGMTVFGIGVLLGRWYREYKDHWSKFIYVAVYASAFIMFWPVNAYNSAGGLWGVISTVFLSLFTAMQTFGMGCEFAVVNDALIECPDAIAGLYQSLVSVIFVAAPVCTFTFAISFFKNLMSHLKYRTIYRKHDVFVFSEINERSITLAKSIKNNHENSSNPFVLVFTDVLDSKEEEPSELFEEVKKLGAICFKDDILAIDFEKHDPEKEISFFIIGDNQAENLSHTINLVEKYKERENTNMYFFSTSTQSEMVFSSLNKGKIKARRINEIRSLVNRILYDQGKKFFNVENRAADGTKLISAMIVGMGQHGTEMAKALAWFCQMDGYSFEINGFDKDKLAEEKFKQKAPALFSSGYNIKIQSACDVDTDRFGEMAKALTNTSYVLVSLGDDDKNVKTAVYLRMCFERIGIKPVIQAIVNTQSKHILEGIKNFKGQEYNIDFVGDLESSYSEDVIVNSTLEDEALAVHMGYTGSSEEEFWSFEYNYRSSTATAIHNRAKEICHIPGIDKKDSERTKEELEILQQLEHRRWNAYMHSEGYEYGVPRNDLAKMHNNITAYEALDDETKRKDSLVVIKNKANHM